MGRRLLKLAIVLLTFAASNIFHSNPGASPVLGQRRTVSAKTANYTITADETGTIFTTYGAGAAVTFTLPAVAAGLYYDIYSAANQNLVVAAPSANTMVAFNDVTASQVSLQTANQLTGGGFRLWSDGTSWMVAPIVDPAATVTVTT